MTNFACNLAIAIGINNYRNGIAELKTARPDAEKLADLLATDYKYQVELITDETDLKPTLTELKTLLTEWLPQRLQPPAENNRLLFYFAGHGMSLESDDGPRGFLLPQNADPKDPTTFLPMQELHDALIALPCHHLLVILDCCFAGTFRWSSTRKAIPIPETIHRQHYDRFIRYPAWQVIASSAHNQEALDFLSDKRGISEKDEQHSPFAEALFEALQDDEPDEKGNRYKKADLTKDGVITAPELYLYLRDNVETRSGERQTPGLFPLKRHDRGEYIFHDPKFDPNTLSEAPELDEASNPYRGLKPFEEQHARFFFGRQTLIDELAKRLSKPDQALTVVLGVSGSGKSSLVKAGLIPHLRNQNLVQLCLSELLIQFPPSPLKLRLMNRIHQWKILAPMRPGESPFASLARTLFAIVDMPVSPQLKQLDFVSKHLEDKLKQLNTEIDQLVIQEKVNSSKTKQLQRLAEMLTQLIADWNDVSPVVRQRSLVEHFEMLYALCQTKEQDSEQQQHLKQAFQDCLAPLIQQLRPNSGSLVAIAQEWSQNHPDQRLLLVIDQFEELTTLGRTTLHNAQSEQSDEWQQFFRLMETTLAANLPQLRITVTLRSDFEPRFLSSEALKPYWSKARFPVRAMRSDELRQAIEGPASEMALYFEPANLVDRLIDEVGQMPGALPLLSFTLSELYVKLADKWKNQETSDRALTIDAEFDKEGGVAGSLTRKANEEYDKLINNVDPNDQYEGGFGQEEGKAYQVTMRRVMLRMLTLEGGETARRRVPDSELVYPTQEESDQVKAVVDRLVIARLLVRGQLETGEPYVEPAHDFLVRSWGMLQDWINEEKAKETLELQQRLTAQANDWERSDRPNGLLLPDGDRLTQLEKMLSLTESWLNQQEKEFIESSIAYREIQSKRARELRVRAELRQKATKVENLLPVQPLDSLVLAVQAIGQNLDDLPGEILPPVQTSLHQVMRLARVSTPLQGHDGPIYSVAFSSDGQIIISGSYDKTLRLWDAKEKSLIAILRGHRGLIHSVAFSHDRQMIVSGSSDNTVRLWDLKGNLLGKPLEGHNSSVLTVAFSPDGQIVVSGSDDNTVRLWDLEGNPIGLPIEGHKDSVLSVAFSPDGQIIASGSSDKTLRLWDLEGNLIAEPLEGHEEPVRSVAFSPDGQIIASGSSDYTIRLWDLKGNLIGEPLEGQHYGDVYSVVFSLDGKSLASGSHDKTVCFWDLKGNPIGKPLENQKGYIYSVAFSPIERIMTGGSSDGVVQLWDLTDDCFSKVSEENEGDIYSVAFSPDGQIFASGSNENKVQLWDLKGNLIGKPFEGHDETVQSVTFSPDGKIIASGSRDKTIRLWDLYGNPIGEPLQGHDEGVYSVVFSPNGQLIASGSRDKTIILWNLKDSSIRNKIEGHQGCICSVVFSPDGETIASGSDDHTVRLWDLRGNPFGEPLKGHEGFVYSVAFSRDGQLIVSGSRDKTIRLWDLEGRPIGNPLQGHMAPVVSVAFSPDGQTIISSSNDKTIRLWDLKGNPIGEPLHHDLGRFGIINAAVVSPNGKMVASGSDNGNLRLWQIDWYTWLKVCCDRLCYHPVFTNPEAIEDLEQREIAIAACETCKKYVWNKDETD